MDCWAALLGDCAGGFSREHLISNGIFDDEVITAFGLAWCKERPVQIGQASAVAKILCKRHNEALSSFDSEATKLSQFLSANVLDDPLSEAQTTLRGVLLEKWALKTFLNLGYVGGLDPEHHTRVLPEAGLITYLFRDTEVPTGIGLYFVTGAVSNHGYKIGLSWNAIRNMSDAGVIVGMTFTLNDVRFVVSAAPGPAEKRIARMGVVNEVDYSKAKILYRPANIVLLSKTAGRKTIILEW